MWAHRQRWQMEKVSQGRGLEIQAAHWDSGASEGAELVGADSREEAKATGQESGDSASGKAAWSMVYKS